MAESQASVVGPRDRWAGLAMAALGALVLLLGAQGGALWAFDYLRWVAWPLRTLGAALVVLVAVPGVADRLDALIRRSSIAARLASWPRWPLILASGPIFWLLREWTYRGDALRKLDLLRSQTLRSDAYAWKEPLDSVFAYSATALFRRLNLGPEVVVAALSVVAGMIYVGAALAASDRIGATPGRRLGALAGLLALGTSQLWFGHIENYSLVTSFAMVTSALALSYLAPGGGGPRPRLWQVGLAAGAAVSFHPQALFAMPALLVLLDRRSWRRGLVELALGCAAAPLLTVGVMRLLGSAWPQMTGGFAGDPQMFWTLGQALNPRRLLDALSNLWLMAPLLPLFLVAGVARLADRTCRTDRRFVYVTILAVSMLFYFIFFQNDLPRRQDWDLFAIVGPALALWGLYSWLGFDEGACHRLVISGRTSIYAGLLVAVLLSAAWVGVNHSYTLIRPDAALRGLYERYRLTDLISLLPEATVEPDRPFCADPSSDPTGCQRVFATTFTMPQDGDTREVIFAHAPARITFDLGVPAEPSFLWISPALDPLAWGWGGDGVTFRVWVEDGGIANLLWERHLTPSEPADRGFVEAFVPLNAFAGRRVRLVLETDPGPAGNADADRAGWGMPWLMRGTLAAPE